jgi:hypothetical protein
MTVLSVLDAAGRRRSPADVVPRTASWPVARFRGQFWPSRRLYVDGWPRVLADAPAPLRGL